MSPGESLIILLLTVIAWLLYQIVKQLSYLTGRLIRLSIFNRPVRGVQFSSKARTKTKSKLDEDPLKKLPN